jgi:hypothetical protein
MRKEIISELHQVVLTLPSKKSGFSGLMTPLILDKTSLQMRSYNWLKPIPTARNGKITPVFTAA